MITIDCLLALINGRKSTQFVDLFDQLCKNSHIYPQKRQPGSGSKGSKIGGSMRIRTRILTPVKYTENGLTLPLKLLSNL